LLYSSNAFDFRYPHTLVAFCSTVPNHRLNQLRSLHLTCDILGLGDDSILQNAHSVDPTSTVLENCFMALSRLEGLRVLRIENRARDRHSRNYHWEFSRGIQGRLVGLLREIRAEISEVKTPWFEGDLRREVGGLMDVNNVGS
jgi:hypothetical protein